MFLALVDNYVFHMTVRTPPQHNSRVAASYSQIPDEDPPSIINSWTDDLEDVLPRSGCVDDSFAHILTLENEGDSIALLVCPVQFDRKRFVLGIVVVSDEDPSTCMVKGIVRRLYCLELAIRSYMVDSAFTIL